MPGRARRRGRGSAALTTVALCALVGLTLPSPGAAAAPAARSTARTYVALGDSFAAGPGIPDATGGACLRSTANYPQLVAARLGLALTDVTCSGATTANVVDTPQGAAAPQVQALSSDTDLVTLTIGNNDVRLTKTSIDCSLVAGPCIAPDQVTAIAAAVRQLPRDLTRTLRAVKRAAPRAAILVVTYPRTFPADGAPCPPQNPMGAADSRRLADLAAALQRRLVAAARAADAALVDTYRPLGHDVCSPEARRWVEGAAPESPALVWHPNERGMQAQAVMVARAIGRIATRR